ncbi:MAG: glycoside hydrolase domain-containing protein [Armatimonadota bacterium]
MLDFVCKTKNARALFLCVALALLVGGAASSAESWNAFNDFSSTTNPNHNWSYVSQPGGAWAGTWAFTPMVSSASYANWWETPSTPAYYEPMAGATAEWERLKLTGCKIGDGGSKVAALGLLEWTAPSSGYYRISGDVYVYPDVNARLFAYSNRLSEPLLNVSVNSSFDAKPFDKTALLNKDDKVVFGGEPINGYGTYQGVRSYWTSEIQRVPVVPAPWTPISVAGTTVSCWNRTYDFTNNLLPCRINSGSVELLSASVQLVAKISSTQEQWGGVTYSVQQSDPDIVKMITSATSSRLKVTCKYQFEFDGMLLCDLTVAPNSGSVTLSSLDIVLPMNSTYAKLYHHHPAKALAGQNWATDPVNAGAIPSAGMSLPFVHHIWLGDEKRGLQWFAESDQGLAPVGSFISIDSGRQMKLSLTGTKTVSQTQPFHFVFGLMASPVKPAVATNSMGWTMYGGGVGIWNHDYYGSLVEPMYSRLAQMNTMGVNCFALWDAQDAFNDPVISNPDLSNLLSACNGYGMAAMAASGVWVEASAQNYPTGSELMPLQTYYVNSDVNRPSHAMCAKGTYAQWLLDRANIAFNQNKLGGIYLDGTACLQKCFSATHGCAYTDTTGSHGTAPILAARELMKQLYMMSRSVNWRTYLVAHTSSSVMLPVLSFADAYVDGEHLNRVPDGVNYTIEAYRAEMMGHQYGIPAFHLMYWSNYSDETRESAYALLHDMSPRSERFSPNFWKAYGDFGAFSAQWIPYWESQCPITTGADLKISAYVKPGKGALAVVANLTYSSITAALHIDRAALGLGADFRVRNAYSGTVLSVDSDTASVTVGPGSYSVIQTYLPVASVAVAKGIDDGVVVSLPARTISAKYNGSFYVEDDNKTTGIKVVGTTNVVEGNKVTVTGYMTTTDGERRIIATKIL